MFLSILGFQPLIGMHKIPYWLLANAIRFSLVNMVLNCACSFPLIFTFLPSSNTHQSSF